MNNDFKPQYKQIAERLIEALRSGTSPFQKPWREDMGTSLTLPLNPTTGKNYQGMNALWLTMQDRGDPRWMTLKQASFNHWQVETGARATLISFVKTSEIQPVLDEKGQRVVDQDGRAQTRTIQLEKPIITGAWVFNGEQIKGLPPWREVLEEKRSKQTWMPVERAENIIVASKAAVAHGGNEAFYDLANDKIQIPGKQQFASATQYYATLLHELGHWTGHPGRMDRPMGDGFGSEAYAREELRAEIASLMMGSELQIGHHFGQHAAYVESWIRVLQNDPFELYKASRDAQKIFDYIIDIEQKRVLSQTLSSRANGNALLKDQVIAYNNTAYKVVEVLKGRNLKLEDLTTGAHVKLSPNDGLYGSLLQARNNPAAQGTSRKAEQAAEFVEQQQSISAPRMRR
jgi:antirestriction protein ArdC